jgi:hypothetical protein
MKNVKFYTIPLTILTYKTLVFHNFTQNNLVKLYICLKPRRHSYTKARILST